MRSVNIAKLKARLSEYLRDAQAGETIHVLDRRREVATIQGVLSPHGMAVARRLVAQGLAEWHGGKPSVRPLKPRRGPARVAHAVLDDRS